ncbi:uroporphyrinogen-III synthase, partial [Klebsiella pneumoniae]|nr:uroporphyrinogen-III synthase [Klebsiella pneumoniae]
MSGWRLLLTRPDEECAALAASLGEAGVHSSSLPLLAIDPLEETPEQRTLMLDLDRYCAVVVVSKPAARLGLERLDRYWPQPPQQTWCSVGAATAAILEAYGLDVTYPEQGDDSEALLALPAFQDSLRVHDPKVLIMRGEGGREFLAERLR